MSIWIVFGILAASSGSTEAEQCTTLNRSFAERPVGTRARERTPGRYIWGEKQCCVEATSLSKLVVNHKLSAILSITMKNTVVNATLTTVTEITLIVLHGKGILQISHHLSQEVKGANCHSSEMGRMHLRQVGSRGHFRAQDLSLSSRMRNGNVANFNQRKLIRMHQFKLWPRHPKHKPTYSRTTVNYMEACKSRLTNVHIWNHK